MNIFEEIKNGNLPDKNVIFTILETNYKENNKEISKYIEILENAYKSSNDINEKVLLNDVVFILKLISSNNREKSIYFYLDNIFSLHVHYIPKEYIDFIKKFLEFIDVDLVISYLDNRLTIIDKWHKFELRSFLNWILHVVWNTPSFFNTSKFNLLYDNLKSLLYKLIEQSRIDEVMYVEFFIYHIMGNSFQTQREWRDFNQDINKVCSEVYFNYAKNNNLPKIKENQNKKKRIALIRDRMVNNSPFNVEYSLLKSLQEDKNFTDNYEIAVYSMNYFEKNNDEDSIIKKFLDIGIPVISPAANFMKDGYYNNHLQKALKIRETLINDNIDIMIGCVSGYDIMGFLFSTRTAPLQIYWCHGNFEYDVIGIDKRITHILDNRNESRFNFCKFRVNTLEEFINPNANSYYNQALQIKNRWSKDIVILGSIGRLIKIDNKEYLEMVANVLKQNPDTIYLACGSGNIKELKEKVKQLGVEDRFYFEGQINPHIYGYVIDVYLNTFPEPSGQALVEFASKEEGFIVSKTDPTHFMEVTISKYIENVNKYIKLKRLEKKYPKIKLTKEDFWNLSLLKENKELYLSYDILKNKSLIYKILNLVDNIVLIVSEEDKDKFNSNKIIIENDIYKRAYNSDFFIFFEENEDLFRFVLNQTTARQFSIKNHFITKYNWKRQEEDFYKDVIKHCSLLGVKTSNVVDGMWNLLKDCFKNYKEFKKFWFNDKLKDEFLVYILSMEAKNPCLLAKYKILSAINRIKINSNINKQENNNYTFLSCIKKDINE